MVGMFVLMCLASKKSSEREFFIPAGMLIIPAGMLIIPAGMLIGVKLLTA